MATIRNKATLDSKPFSSGVDQMKAKVNGFAGSIKSMKTAISGAFAVGAVMRFAKSALDTADEIDNLTKQTGLNVEEVQALKIAAEEAGIGFDTMRPTINQFRRALDQAVSGNQVMIKSFSALGIEMEDIAGLSVGDSLDIVTKKMYENRDSAEVMAESVRILGSESTRVQGILFELGEIGIGGLTDKYQDYTRTLEEIRLADRQQERLDRQKRRTYTMLSSAVSKLAGGYEVFFRSVFGQDYDEIQEAMFGNIEEDLKRREKAEQQRRQLMKETAEATALLKLKELNEQRRFNKLTEEQQQRELRAKIDALNAELELAKTAQERLEITREIAAAEEKIKKDKDKDKDKKYGDLRAIGANLITPESLGRFGELDPRANISKDRAARLYEIYGKLQTEQGKKMMRYMQDIADNTSNNQAVL